MISPLVINNIIYHFYCLLFSMFSVMFTDLLGLALNMWSCSEVVFITLLNPFMPEFTIVLFIHYKPRIAAAILDL